MKEEIILSDYYALDFYLNVAFNEIINFHLLNGDNTCLFIFLFLQVAIFTGAIFTYIPVQYQFPFFRRNEAFQKRQLQGKIISSVVLTDLPEKKVMQEKQQHAKERKRSCRN